MTATVSNFPPLYLPSNEMLWKVDPQIEALRKNPHWGPFHREAGKRSLYFDKAEKQGRGYTCVAFTAVKKERGGLVCHKLSEGVGRTPADAYGNAYRDCGRRDALLDDLWDRVTGKTVTVDEDELLEALGDDEVYAPEAGSTVLDDEFDALFD